METHLLLCRHNILVARTEYLVHLRHTLRSVGHSAYCLNAASLEYLAHSSHTSGGENGRVHLSFLVRRGAKHNLPASRNLCRCGQHQYSTEEWGSTARNIQAYFLDGHTLLPASHSLAGLYLFSLKALCIVELIDVRVGEFYRLQQLIADRSKCLVNLRFGNGKTLKCHMVELQFILLYRHISTCLYVVQHLADRIVEL